MLYFIAFTAIALMGAGKISVADKPGLGFTLNEDAVCRAEEAYNKKKGL